MKKINYFKPLNSVIILGLLFLVFSFYFSQPVFSCELSITPSGIDITVNETKTLLIIRKQIHKKCGHNINSVVISYENCELISQSDWIIEGIDSKKEIVVSFPLAGKASVIVSNTCDLFPIRPFKAGFTVIEAAQEKPVPPPETAPPPSEPIPPEENSTTPPPEVPTTPTKSENPPSLTPNTSPSTPSEPVKTTTQPLPSPEKTNSTEIPALSQNTTVVPPGTSISSSEPTVEVPVVVPVQKETKWTDFFMRYQFYILSMLLLLSIMLNVTLQSNFRPIIQLISVGYLGFYTGGCLCAIGLVEKAALFRLSTAMGIFSFVFLGLLFVVSVFFGRVFCGWVCPHGALQEFLFRFPLKKNPNQKNKNLFLVIIPGLVFLSVFLVSFFWRISLICAYDPFTVPFQLAGSTVVMVLFLIIAFFSLLFFRPFCKYLCPLGFILGIASWVGDKLKMRWTGKSVQCTTCASCRKECSSQALIDHGQELYISSYDCIECGNCHQRCAIQNNLEKKKLLKHR